MKKNTFNEKSIPPQSQLKTLLDCFQKKLFEDAEKLALSITKEYPNHQFSWKVLGAILEQTGRKFEALNSHQRVVAITPNDSEAHFILANSLRELGLLEDAEKSYLKAIALKSDHMFSYNNLASTQKELGRINESLANFKKAIKLKPDFAQAHNNLSLILKDIGRFDEAEEGYKKAIELKPDYAQAYYNMGIMLKDLGRLEEAEVSYKKAIELKPDYIRAYYNMGIMLKDLGRLEDAVANYKKAIELKPDYAQAYNNLGVALKDLGRLEEAEASYKKAIELKPDYAQAYNNLAATLKEFERFQEALECTSKAIELNPDYPQAYYNMGIMLKDLGRLEDAVANYKKAIELKPDYAQAYNNLGTTLRELCQLEEAEASYKKAIELKSDYSRAYFGLGNTYKDLGKVEEAVANYKKAIELKPDYAEANYNWGRTLILNKSFKKGHELMEWRWQTDQPIGKYFKSFKPTWDGSKNQKVLLWREQGIGDEIMLSSMIPQLQSNSKKLIVECDQRLIPLLKRSFSKKLKYVTDRNKVDGDHYNSHLPIGSLPLHFRKKENDFLISSEGWLKADSHKSNDIRKKITNEKNRKIVGISWNTNSILPDKIQRNIKLEILLQPLKKLETEFVSLQYGNTSEEISSLRSKYGIDVLEIPEIDLYNDIDGLASVISACDFVVSIDNVTPHLAGALGIDTYLLLPLIADERWGLNTKNSYWYKSIKVYRQITRSDWSTPLAKLSNDLVMKLQ